MAFLTRKKIDEKPLYVPYPFFLGYTASLLRKQGYNVFALDGVAIDIHEDEFIERTLAKCPDIILMETTTPSFYYDINLAMKIKKIDKNILIVMSGTHATVFPEEALKSGYVDYVISGEYEITFAKLIEKLSKNLPLDDIKGISYRKNGNIILGGHSELIYPLDLLPIPDREIFPDDESPNINIYWDSFCQYRPAIQMHASRGCPFRCYFCLWNQVMYKNGRYRTFSLKRIVDEIETVIKKFRPEEIYFDDDDFTVQKDYVINLCKEIVKKGIKFKWSCMGNIMNLDEEMIYEMKKAGCIGIKFGIESANKEILKTLGKPMNLKKAKYNVYLLNKAGIKTHAAFTFGLLKETKESMKETLAFSKNLDTDSVQFSITVPFPGTKFFDILKEQQLLNNLNLQDFNGSHKCVFRYPSLTDNDIETFFKNAYNEWIKHKLLKVNWIFRQAKRILKILLVGNTVSRKYLFKVIHRTMTYWLKK